MIDQPEPFYDRLNRSGNYLLMKTGVGKPRQAPNPLPRESFAYGHAPPKDKEGVQAVISSWNVHQRSKPARSTETDYQRMNRLGVSVGAATARQQTAVKGSIGFKRRYYEGRMYQPPITDGSNKAGVPTKPSTPIHGVIGNLYGRVAHDVANSIYQRPNTSTTKALAKQNRGTRAASLLQNFIAEKYLRSPEKRDPFRLARFSRAGPKVNSYRVNLNRTIA